MANTLGTSTVAPELAGEELATENSNAAPTLPPAASVPVGPGNGTRIEEGVGVVTRLQLVAGEEDDEEFPTGGTPGGAGTRCAGGSVEPTGARPPGTGPAGSP
ncbi:MAG: hypothetical protein L3J86_06515, partial [Thermoplasmata archaeon]|nr:hypothetical protein [Thermoplasmata archaeon]